MEAFASYHGALSVLAATGLMMFVQVLVADVAGMRAGHQPGHPVAADRASFHFRATRALANTNESVALFLCLAVAGVLLGADSGKLNAGAYVYLAGRLGHMAMYYADIAVARSIAFAVALLGVAVMAWAVLPVMF